MAKRTGAKKAAKSPRKKAGPVPITGLRGLSDALLDHGVTRSHAALAKIVKDARWREAGFADRAPWPAKQLAAMADLISTAFQENRNQPAVGESGDLGRATTIAKLKVLIEREATLKTNRLIKEQVFVAREQAEIQGAAKWRTVKAALFEIPKALRQLLADTAEPGKIEDILSDALSRVCNEAFEGGVVR